ncbi:MAG: GYF domain-containing protein [Bacteroidales bacterium]|nr:GYF domain-containing protein [Bacteroidales bacterium]
MKIYIVKDDMRLGPFTLEEVKRQGISADTLVWFKGMPDWKEARAIPELAGAYIPDIPPTAEVDEDDAVEETDIDSAPEPPTETYATQPQPQHYAYAPLPDEGKAKKSKAGIIGIISLLVVMLILCIMVLTKPSKADYIDSITRVTTEYVLDQVGNTPLGMSESVSGTVKFATSKAVRAVLEQTLYVEDCLIFNKAKVSVGEHTFTVGIGMFGHVFTLSKEQLAAAVTATIEKERKKMVQHATEAVQETIDSTIEYGKKVEELDIDQSDIDNAIDSIKNKAIKKGNELVDEAVEHAKEKGKEALNELWN